MAVLAHRIEPVAAAGLRGAARDRHGRPAGRPGAVIRAARARSCAPLGLAFGAAALGSLALFAFALGLLVLVRGLPARAGARGAAAGGRRARSTATRCWRAARSRCASRSAGCAGCPCRSRRSARDGDVARDSTAGSTVRDRPAGRARARPDAAAPARRPRPVRARGRAAARRSPCSCCPSPRPPPAGLRRGGAQVNGDPEPDGLRPYAPGTPMSRIHWPSAARGGGLQERHFVSGRDQLPLVVVDTSSADGRRRDRAQRGGDRARAGALRRLPRAAAGRPRADHARRHRAAGRRCTGGWRRSSRAAARRR